MKTQFDRELEERRIVQNEGRDEDGDLVYRDGKPHPASGTEMPESMKSALRSNGGRA